MGFESDAWCYYLAVLIQAYEYALTQLLAD